jgi:hypothetical protein
MVGQVLVPVTTDTGPNVIGPDAAGDGDGDVAGDVVSEGGAGDGDTDGEVDGESDTPAEQPPTTRVMTTPTRSRPALPRAFMSFLLSDALADRPGVSFRARHGP